MKVKLVIDWIERVPVKRDTTEIEVDVGPGDDFNEVLEKALTTARTDDPRRGALEPDIKVGLVSADTKPVEQGTDLPGELSDQAAAVKPKDITLDPTADPVVAMETPETKKK